MTVVINPGGNKMDIVNLQTNVITSKYEIQERLNNEIEDFFKRKTNNPKASIFDNIYQWNGKYWKKTDRNDFELQCNNVLNDYQLSKKDEEFILRNFILNHIISEDKIDIFSRYLFCMKNCVLCFKENLPTSPENDSPLNGKEYTTLKIGFEKTIYFIKHEVCKEYHLTHCANISFIEKKYRKSDNIKLWKSFLERMIPSLDLPTENTNEKSIPSSDELKTQTIDWLNEFILSLITGKDGNAFFVNLLGPAQCGKSTLVNFLINSLDNYAYTFSKDDLIYSNLENTSALYSLKDSRLLIYSEASRRPFNASFIKEITGGTQFKYGEQTYKIKARLLIDSNYMLQSEAKTDNAFDERYALIPVGPSIPREERDVSLDEKLFAARNDIFSWMIANYDCKAITIPECSDFYKKIMKFSLSPARVFYNSCFIGFYGYVNVYIGTTTGMTTLLKEEDIWIYYINNFKQVYSRMLRNCPFFNYSEDYVDELFNTTQKELINQLAMLHKNVSKACSGNTMKLRFNELDFISDSELETMSLPIAYFRIIKYSEIFKNFRKNITVNIGHI